MEWLVTKLYYVCLICVYFYSRNHFIYTYFFVFIYLCSHVVRFAFAYKFFLLLLVNKSKYAETVNNSRSANVM